MAGCSAPCPSLLVLISLRPELLDPRCFTSLPILLLCRGHPTSLAQPRSPQGMAESRRLSQDTAIPAASTIPSPCPEMLFILQGGGTDAPRFGDFSALAAIGAIWTLPPGQKAPEMLHGICCGFYVPTWSPAAPTLAGRVATCRHLGSILTVGWWWGWGVERV